MSSPPPDESLGWTGAADPPTREVVRAPLLGTADARRASPLPVDLDERTEYGIVLLRSLMRAQLGLGIAVLAVAGGLVGAVPILASLVPELARRRVLGLPLSLVVLGVGVYPLLVGLGWIYVRLAERIERRFLELVDRS